MRIGKSCVSGKKAGVMLAAAMAAAWAGAAPAAELPAAGVEAGFAVVLGGKDGARAAELAAGGKFLVHALAAEPAAVAASRKLLEDRKLYGRASVGLLTGRRLPYADGLANLVLVEDAAALAAAGIAEAEIMRVVCPGGAALLGGAGGEWKTLRKPVTPGSDEWTHERHGPDGNLVSRDKQDVPTAVRWIAGPAWPTQGRKTTVVSAVSTGGRNFYWINGPGLTRGGPQRLSVIARDAYNGVLLWERVWKDSHRAVLAAPPGGYGWTYAPMAAVKDRVYTWVDRKVAALDAATGKTVVTYDATQPVQLICEDGVLLVPTAPDFRAFDAADGKRKWTAPFKAVDMVAGGGKVFCLDCTRQPYDLVAIDIQTGKEAWRQPTAPWSAWPDKPEARAESRPMSLRLYADGRLIIRQAAAVHAVSAEDGRHLWKHAAVTGQHYTGVAALHAGGLIWVPVGAGGVEGLDPATGQTKKASRMNMGGCGMTSGTDRFFLTKFAGAHDVRTGESTTFGSARAPCRLNFLPANGLVYTHAHSCQCVSTSVMYGYMALGADQPAPPDKSPRLEKGPASDANLQSAIGNRQSEDWPTHRHDAARSGATAAGLGADLKTRWEVQLTDWPIIPRTEYLLRPLEPVVCDWGLHPKLSGALTAPTVAGETLYVAVPNAHQVLALDAASGQRRWAFTAGGRVDSPPTIDGGLCIFGCRDGWVYCLRAADGALAWRYRAAPAERLIVAFGQCESQWPVYGSVLVRDGVVYSSAGRVNTRSAGGVTLLALEAATGKCLWEKPAQGVGQNSILVAGGDGLYLSSWLDTYNPPSAKYGSRDARIDPKTGAQAAIGKAPVNHLYVFPFGMTDGSWTRHSLAYRKNMGEWRDGSGLEAQVLVRSAERAFGFSLKGSGKSGRRLFCAAAGADPAGKPVWSVDVAGQVEALALAGETLFAAGTADLDKRASGFLWALSAGDGKKLAEWKLPAAPIYDGLAAAGGRLYVTLETGRALCLGDGK